MSARSPKRTLRYDRNKQRVSLPSGELLADNSGRPFRPPNAERLKKVEATDSGDTKSAPATDKSVRLGRQKAAQVEWDDDADFIEDNDQEADEEDDNLPYPGFVEPALYCLRQAQPPRSWALAMVTNPWFDRLTMMIILINCT